MTQTSVIFDHKQEAYWFWGQKVKMSTTKVVFLKSSIFIPLTWKWKMSCIFGHWIQPPIIFEVKFVLWILQLSCSARLLHVTWKIHPTILTSKIIGGWIQWPNVQILFKFQVNRLKIGNFWNFACVECLVYVNLLAYVDLKNTCSLNSVTWYANPLQISSQSDENWGF